MQYATYRMLHSCSCIAYCNYFSSMKEQPAPTLDREVQFQQKKKNWKFVNLLEPNNFVKQWEGKVYWYNRHLNVQNMLHDIQSSQLLSIVFDVWVHLEIKWIFTIFCQMQNCQPFSLHKSPNYRNTLDDVNSYVHHRILKKIKVTWSNCTAARSTLPYIHHFEWHHMEASFTN